ncbi:MAG: DNA primase large subunit PriL [Candidatus Bathyarchaeia archaeon]
MQTLLTKYDLAKFPFTAEASSYIKSRGIDPLDLVRPELVPILERALERIRQGVFSGRISADLTQEDVDILAYPTALMLISAMRDDRTRRRYALAEAKRAYELLREETPEKLLQVATGTFGWDAKLVERDVGDSHFEFALYFTFYVSNSSRIHDLRWKLVNRVLEGGYVLLPREDFARLLEEEVQSRVLEKTADPTVALPEELDKRVEPLRSMLKARSQYLAADEMPRAVMASAMPPCMKNLLSLLQTSKHISHMGRFAMAAFLLNIGTNEEDLLKMFKTFTDFDERIARYQVEHIAGKRGSRRKYTAPNCGTMRTHGLCINPDELCGTIKHPLSYYRRKARILFRQEKGRPSRRQTHR